MRIYLILLLCLISCWSNPHPPSGDTRIGAQDLLLINEQRAQKERQVIDSLSIAWSWDVDDDAGGVLVDIIERGGGVKNESEDEVLFDIQVSLVNGRECFSFDSLHFVVGHYNGARAFEEIARCLSPGDSCRALVPSDLGYGVRGVPGVVPPGAMLLLEIRQLDSEVDPV